MHVGHAKVDKPARAILILRGLQVAAGATGPPPTLIGLPKPVVDVRRCRAMAGPAPPPPSGRRPQRAGRGAGAARPGASARPRPKAQVRAEAPLPERVPRPPRLPVRHQPQPPGRPKRATRTTVLRVARNAAPPGSAPDEPWAACSATTGSSGRSSRPGAGAARGRRPPGRRSRARGSRRRPGTRHGGTGPHRRMRQTPRPACPAAVVGPEAPALLADAVAAEDVAGVIDDPGVVERQHLAGHGGGARMGLESGGGARQPVRGQLDVGVDQRHELAAGDVHTEVGGVGEARVVGQGDDPHLRVLVAQVLQRPVARAVVDHDHVRRALLPTQGGEAGRRPGAALPVGNGDGDHRTAHASPPRRGEDSARPARRRVPHAPATAGAAPAAGAASRPSSRSRRSRATMSATSSPGATEARSHSSRRQGRTTAGVQGAAGGARQPVTLEQGQHHQRQRSAVQGVGFHVADPAEVESPWRSELGGAPVAARPTLWDEPRRARGRERARRAGRGPCRPGAARGQQVRAGHRRRRRRPGGRRGWRRPKPRGTQARP